jgi:hypothetical protein
MVRFGWGWYGFGLACVEPYDLYNPFVDHTLRLIQHNWVISAYSLNIVILVLIIGESSIGAIFAYHFTIVLFLLLPRIIFFLHLLSTNHECTQPCYFPLLLKPAAQKEKMVSNSSTRSFRLCVAPVAVPVELRSLLLFYFIESHHSL